MHLIKTVNLPPNALILDFFAGSGTTGEAVLQFDQENNTQMSFILVNNNEGQIMEEICYPRLKKVSQGYHYKNQFIAGYGGNLQYFKTEFKQ